MRHQLTAQQLHDAFLTTDQTPAYLPDVIAHLFHDYPDLFPKLMVAAGGEPRTLCLGIFTVAVSATLRALEAQELERLVIQ